MDPFWRGKDWCPRFGRPRVGHFIFGAARVKPTTFSAAVGVAIHAWRVFALEAHLSAPDRFVHHWLDVATEGLIDDFVSASTSG